MVELGSQVTAAGALAAQAGNNLNLMGGSNMAGKTVNLTAGNDILVSSSAVTGSDALVAKAGNDINIVTTTRSTSREIGGGLVSSTSADQAAGLYVTGEGGALNASAGRDIKLQAGQIVNAGKDGTTIIDAGRNIELGTVTIADTRNGILPATKSCVVPLEVSNWHISGWQVRPCCFPALHKFP